MRDYLVRSAFHESVLKSSHGCEDTFVIDELGLKNGAVRADIAVLNGKLVGYEIKTDNDTLLRLPNQVKAYSDVFDKVYIITGNKHLSKILEYVPEWWGVYLVNENSQQYHFSLYRKGKVNKFINPYSLAELLWKDEAIEILTSFLNYRVKTKNTKDELNDLLSKMCSRKQLSGMVLRYLKSREAWRINH